MLLHKCRVESIKTKKAAYNASKNLTSSKYRCQIIWGSVGICVLKFTVNCKNIFENMQALDSEITM